MLSHGFQASKLSAATDEITWRAPRSVAIVIAWSITSTSVILNAFLSGITVLDPFLNVNQPGQWSALLLIFFMSILAGWLLEDMKAIILGAFEAIFLTVLLTYIGMILPVILGNGGGFYEADAIYLICMGYVFTMFFPLIPLSLIGGVIVGGVVKDWLL